MTTTSQRTLTEEFKCEVASDRSSILARIRASIRAWRRRTRLQSAASRFDRNDRPIKQGGILVALSKHNKLNKINGLGRGYLYLIDQLKITEIVSNILPLVQVEGDFPPRVLIFGQPDQYFDLFSKKTDWLHDAHRIGVWLTEFENPPSHWKFAQNIIHEVWTPSTFSANSIRKIFDGEIKIVPYEIRLHNVTPMPRILFGVRDNQFLGLAIMDLRTCPDRKNPIAHLRVWKRAFGKNPDAILLIKANFSKRTQFMRKKILEEISENPNIQIIEQTFDHRDFEAFQRMADVFISLHRAEGYGLNIHEMLEIGTPTVATGYSGNMDYMTAYPHAFPVSYHMVPYKDRTFHYTDTELHWAEANIDEAASVLHDIKKAWLVGEKHINPASSSIDFNRNGLNP